MLKQHAFALADTVDGLGYAIENASSLEPSYADRLLSDYGRKAFSPRGFVEGMIGPVIERGPELVYGNLVQDTIREEFVRPATQTTWRRIDAIRGYSDDVPPPRPQLFVWHSSEASSSTRTLRDNRGTVLLFDRNGDLFDFDEARGAAQYSNGQAARLAQEHGLTPRRYASDEWIENVVVFSPSLEANESLRDELDGWFASSLLREAMREVAGDFIEGTRDEK